MFLEKLALDYSVTSSQRYSVSRAGQADAKKKVTSPDIRPTHGLMSN